MDDGVVYIFNTADEETEGGIPLKPLKESGIFYFEELGIGVEDYEIAKQDAVKLEMRIRVLRGPDVSTLNVARINGLYFTVWKVKHTVNRQGVKVTDITLAATLEGYKEEQA
jgi:allophanate hydrolase subunit 2